MNSEESNDSTRPQALLPMREVERRYIARVLELTRGNRTEASRILGFDRKTLYRKLRRYNLASVDDLEPGGGS